MAPRFSRALGKNSGPNPQPGRLPGLGEESDLSRKTYFFCPPRAQPTTVVMTL